MSTVSVDIIIPTLNESTHIAEAIAGAGRLGKVYVLDSLSTDGTQEIARGQGALVVEHPFVGYADQKNWGLSNLPLESEWVFILDADERITPALEAEIRALLETDPPQNGFYVNRLLIFMGRPIRHGGIHPSWNLRLLRRGKARYEQRSVHEHMLCEGQTGYLKHHMLHIRRESLSQYLAKHIHYADLESDEWVRMRSGGPAVPIRSLFRSTLALRQWLKRRVWLYLPARPLLRFAYMYFLRLGCLDGRAGWHKARMMMGYEYMIGVMYREKMMRARAREGARSTAMGARI